MSPKPRTRRSPEHAPAEKKFGETASGLERLVFFSDAVFAIAITLLALDIRLPSGFGSLSDGELLRALLDIWPKYLSFTISFLVIGSFWLGHHRKFRFIIAYDDRMLIFNLLMLMAIAFIPFPTAVVSESPTRTATIFYALTIIVAGLLSALVWWYAARDDRLVAPGLDAKVRQRAMMRYLAVPVVFLLSIGVAFINPDWGRFSWVLALPATLAVRM
jgi:TMEM175 potassium channel family protein